MANTSQRPGENQAPITGVTVNPHLSIGFSSLPVSLSPLPHACLLGSPLESVPNHPPTTRCLPKAPVCSRRTSRKHLEERQSRYIVKINRKQGDLETTCRNSVSDHKCPCEQPNVDPGLPLQYAPAFEMKSVQGPQNWAIFPDSNVQPKATVLGTVVARASNSLLPYKKLTDAKGRL